MLLIASAFDTRRRYLRGMLPGPITFEVPGSKYRDDARFFIPLSVFRVMLWDCSRLVAALIWNECYINSLQSSMIVRELAPPALAKPAGRVLDPAT